MKKIGFCDDAITATTETYEKIKNDKLFNAAYKKMEQRITYCKIDEIDLLAKKYALNTNTLTLCILMCALPIMEKIYKDNGYSQEFFWENTKDFLVKANECYNIHGIWGHRHLSWGQQFIEGEIFYLGRLQYEPQKYNQGEFEGLPIKNGDDVICIHIPSGSPLIYEDVLKSLDMACEFFGKNFGDKTIFRTATWMLFEGYMPLFKEGSNLKKFADLFTIYRTTYSDTFNDVWRVFSVEDANDITKLPADTSLRRAFIEHIKNGGKFGASYGYIIWPKEYL